MPALPRNASAIATFRVSSAAYLLVTWTVQTDASGLGLGLYAGSPSTGTLVSQSATFGNSVIAFTTSQVGAGTYSAVFTNTAAATTSSGVATFWCGTTQDQDHE